MKSKEEKLSILTYEYNQVDKDALLQLFSACNESMAEVRSILDQSFERRKTPKNALYQSSISSLVGKKTQKRTIEHEERKYKLPKPSIDVNGKPRRKTKVISLHNEEQIEYFLQPYVSLYRNFLPQETSDRLLVYLLENKHFVETKKFYLFDKLCTSHSQSTFMYVPKDFDRETAIYRGKIKQIYEFNEDFMAVADKVNKFINEEISPKYKKLPFQPPEYEVSGCVVNYYESLSNHLDWHSDQLQSMGPHNYITSVSLGATREFRLKRHSDPYTVYSIQLPHNCLLVMHPGCQELFKHCVNPMKTSVQLHPVCGSQRFNLTFRYFPRSFTSNVPRCKCDMPMSLRRSFKTPEESNFGKYHWTCENVTQNKDCKTFHWADFTKPEQRYIAENEDEASAWREM